MQPYPFQQPHPMNAPASSKALTKLKNDKLIPTPFQIQGPQYITFPTTYQAQQGQGQGQIQIQSSTQGPFNNINLLTTSKNQIKFNSSFDQQSRGIQPASFNIQRQNSGGSLLSNSQNISQTYSQNEVGKPINMMVGSGVSQQGPPSLAQQTQNQQNSQTQIAVQPPSIPSTNITKPLSAFQRTNNMSTNVDISRMRSSSASQFSFNNFNDPQKQKRISHLQAKLVDYNEQILQSNIKLNEKQKKITQLEQQLIVLRNSNSETILKLKQFQEGDAWRKKKVNELEILNKTLQNKKQQLQNQTGTSSEKIKNLETSLDKILQSKNIQIQQLNQSCKQLSKHVQLIQDKYEQQIRTLMQKIETQQEQIKKSQIFIQNANLRLRSHEQHKQTNQLSLQVYTRKLNQNAQFISNLENQNRNLKSQLSRYIQMYEKVCQSGEKNRVEYDIVKDELGRVRQELYQAKEEINRVIGEWGNQRKIGSQQIQFLNGKVEEAALEKERLKEEIQLTKAITLKRNMIFQRRVIYELKQQNDRLWAKLIQKSDTSATQYENSPEYWNSYRFQSSSSAYNFSNQPQPQSQPQKPSAPTHLQQKYRAFIEQIQRQQSQAQAHISQLKQKQQRNNAEDMQFYKNKCINLQKMVEEHLQINLELKRQLERVCGSGEGNGVAQAQVTILRGQLQKQRILHQSLQRSFLTFKQQYQQRFKLAQQKVTEIEQQHRKQIQTDSNIKLISEQQKIMQRMQQDIQKLNMDNSHLNIKISEANRWESLYKELKAKFQQMSPIGIWKAGEDKYDGGYGGGSGGSGNGYGQGGDVDKLMEEIQRNRNLLRAKDQEIANIKRVYDLRCDSYEQQIRTKQNELGLLQRDLQKIQRQFGSGKLRYDQLVRDITRLQSELQSYKTGASARNPSSSLSQSLAYNLNLLKSKLKQVQAFIKQARNIFFDKGNGDQKQGKNIEVQKQIVVLFDGIDSCVRDCFGLIGKVQVDSRG